MNAQPTQPQTLTVGQVIQGENCHLVVTNIKSQPKQKSNMNRVIGFATQFYTLWDYRKETSYTEVNGKYYATGVNHCYTFIKSISTDLAKVQTLYPGVSIDTDLKGKTRSWERSEVIQLPANVFSFGRYCGSEVDQILATDIKYCHWFCRNQGGSTAVYISTHPLYAAYVAQREAEKLAYLSEFSRLSSGTQEITFTSNGYNYDEETNECFARTEIVNSETGRTTTVAIRFPNCKVVNGMYPYIMPSVNGKPTKTKGKTFTLNIEIVGETETNWGLTQYANLT